MKPGYKTSEHLFTWLPWVAFFAVLALMATGRIDAEFAQWVLVALGGGGSWATGRYSESRAKVKGAG